MAKRFIDTGIFDNNWFMNISKDAKLLWIYLLTKCDHAGIIEENPKLIEFQTGIKSYLTVRKELGNSLVTLKENKMFIPKFIEYQYTNPLNSNVKAQESVIKLLSKYDLYDIQNQTVKKEFDNSSATVKDKNKDISKDMVKVMDKDKEGIVKGNHLFENSEFYDIEKFRTQIESNPKYEKYDIEHYYEVVKNWSANGKIKKDWIATARNMMLNDLKDCKAKYKNQYANSNKPKSPFDELREQNLKTNEN